MKLKENENLPSEEIFVLEGGEPIKKSIEEYTKGKKVIIFGLPGAYTSVCSAKHLPGYVKNIDAFKSKGIDHVICMSVNDPFVMSAWGKEHNVGDKIVMAVCGRYILNPAIFKHLKLTKSDKSGEIQLTDAIRSLLKDEDIYATIYNGEKFDCGSKEGFVHATISLALRDESINKKIKKIIQDIV